jgi:dTDP-4-dehydrorhamnose 3,5-epimerase
MDRQTIDPDWEFTDRPLIEGVQIREMRSVPKRAGWLVEIFRAEWLPDNFLVDQVFPVTLFSGTVSAWHTHAETTDRLFASSGMAKVVLYDSRSRSPTFGLLNEFILGERRPGLLIVPPRVFHGVKNIGPDPLVLLNLVDRAYAYEDPDHWRVREDSPDIPYRF